MPLWVPANEFNGSIDNFGSTWSDAGFGTSHTTGAANTKGTPTTLLSALAEDGFGIAICFAAGGASAQSRTFLADLLIDPAGGTSWSVYVANILGTSMALSQGGYWYYFPLYFKNGTAIGIQIQCDDATIAVLTGIKVYTKPSHPHLLKVGTRVQTYGADTATSRGTSITPGTNAKGSYTASLGTLSYDQWYWEAGFSYVDASMAAHSVFLDVAANATNKVLCAEDIHLIFTALELGTKAPTGGRNIRRIAAGQDIYVRAAATGAPELIPTACAYGVGD